LRFIALAVLALAACSTPRTPTDYDVVLKRPRPANEEARRQECSWIATSIAREKKLVEYVTATSTYPTTAVAYQDATQRNTAVLQTRSQQIGCQAAAANAERTKEQCFDACNK